MKWLTYILVIVFCIGSAEINARPKPKNKNSCTMFKGKFTTSDQIEYNFGIVVGENIATIKSQKGASQDVIMRMMGGLAVQIVWPKGFAVQPEVLYSQKGCMFAGSGLRYDIDYVEVPVQLMYRIHMAEVKPFGFIAPYGAYAIRLTQNGDMISDDTYARRINKWDYGIGAGAGFDIWKIQLSFKYSWGFAKVIDQSYTVRNKVFTVSAGFLF